MDRYARWNALLELLTETGRISVEDAAERLDVSQATIRRDFDQLAQQQMITRTRGGAVANGVSYDLPLRYKIGQALGRRSSASAPPPPPWSRPAWWSASTAAPPPPRWPGRWPSGPTWPAPAPTAPQLTVVTNALNIANELLVRSRMKIVVTGGVVRPQSFELVGPLGGGILREVTLDLALLGVDAFDAELGAASHHEGEAAMNSLMVARARRVVIIADSSKLGGHAFARVCPAEKVHVLVTDAEAGAADVAPFRALGIDVRCV